MTIVIHVSLRGGLSSNSFFFWFGGGGVRGVEATNYSEWETTESHLSWFVMVYFVILNQANSLTI